MEKYEVSLVAAILSDSSSPCISYTSLICKHTQKHCQNHNYQLFLDCLQEQHHHLFTNTSSLSSPDITAATAETKRGNLWLRGKSFQTEVGVMMMMTMTMMIVVMMMMMMMSCPRVQQSVVSDCHKADSDTLLWKAKMHFLYCLWHSLSVTQWTLSTVQL